MINQLLCLQTARVCRGEWDFVKSLHLDANTMMPRIYAVSLLICFQSVWITSNQTLQADKDTRSIRLQTAKRRPPNEEKSDSEGEKRRSCLHHHLCSFGSCVRGNWDQSEAEPRRRGHRVNVSKRILGFGRYPHFRKSDCEMNVVVTAVSESLQGSRYALGKPAAFIPL